VVAAASFLHDDFAEVHLVTTEAGDLRIFEEIQVK